MHIARISHSRQSGTAVYVMSDAADTCFVVNFWRDRASSEVTKFSTKKNSDRDERPVGRDMADYVMTFALNALAKGVA